VEAEEYHQTLIAMATQVKSAQVEFKTAAKALLSMLSECILTN